MVQQTIHVIVDWLFHGVTCLITILRLTSLHRSRDSENDFRSDVINGSTSQGNKQLIQSWFTEVYIDLS